MKRSTRIVCLSFFIVPIVLICQDRGMKMSQQDPQPEKRVALVIGNGAYRNISALKNPPNDAKAIAVALRSLGFEVICRVDVNKKEMRRAIQQFGDAIRGSGVGLFYYAGHGVQSSGRNYLIPVNADIASEGDVEDEAVSVDQILSRMGDAGNRMNIVVLDACRNNPLSSFRSVSRGLTQVVAPTGTFIAFATAPGSVAEDGEGTNGVYTQALLKEIAVPGVQLEDMFKSVLSDVKKRTRGKQVPWTSSSVDGKFYFASSTAEATLPETKLPKKPQSKEFSLSDLDTAAKNEEEVKNAWANTLKQMKIAYNDVVSYEKRDVSANLKAAAWKRFLAAYADDNPYATEDNSLRSKGQTQLTYWNRFETEDASAVAGRNKTLESSTSLPPSLVNGLIAFYPFDGNANDESKNSRGATIHGGAHWENSSLGAGRSVLGFDGSTYLTLPNSDGALNFDIARNEFTLSMWVSLSSSIPNGDDQTLIIDRSTDDNSQCSYAIVYRHSEDRFFINCWNKIANPDGILAWSATRPSMNTWYHLVLASTTREYKLYVNGVLEASSAIPSSFQFASTKNHQPAISVGRTMPGVSNYFVGKMANLRIYGRTLSESEIVSLFHEMREN
jgi:hypothetical protein